MYKNIVILTMSVGIGGAETHIYELACALAGKGHSVTVFSAGGVYEEKLEQHGVRHIKAPLNSKAPSAIFRACRIVGRYVKANKPCIIHSHSRISNFTASIVARHNRVPFVTTIHGSYKTGVFQRIFTRWGDRAMTVSEDLIAYAADNYGFNPDMVSVTVNGINTQTFRRKEYPELRNELGLSDSAKIILSVSRLAPDGGEHVIQLLDMAERIYKAVPDSRIVIVGGGSWYNKVKKKADAVNAVTTDGFVQLTGPQTEIYRYCAIAGLFVGISRSALEAMACEVPTVLLGDHGYLGLFSSETEQACIDTNFTCRGFPFPDDNVIADLICNILSEPDKYAESTKRGFELVREKYSVSRMAEDALRTYTLAEREKRPYDVMICGYYGRNNFGDDLALKALIANIRKKCGAKRIILLTADGSSVDGMDVDVSIHRFNLRRIYKYMKETRLFILGSGSILQDATSSRSIFYYLYVTEQAVKHGCRVMLYSNGIGPINRPSNIKRTIRVLNRADMITVRDRKSLVYMRSIGVDNPNIELAGDETFTLDRNDKAESHILDDNGRYLCINLRESSISDEFLDAFAVFTDRVADKYKYTPVLLPLHRSQDFRLLRKLSERLKSEHIFVTDDLPHEQVIDILSRCDAAVIERLHGIIFNCIYGNTFIAINYDPKVMSFCTEMGMEDYTIDLTETDAGRMCDKFDLLMENRDDVIKTISKCVAQKRKLAENNARSAGEILN